MAGVSKRRSQGRLFLSLLLGVALVVAAVFVGLGWHESRNAAITEDATAHIVRDEQRLTKQVKSLDAANTRTQKQLSVIQSNVRGLPTLDDRVITAWNSWVPALNSFLDAVDRQAPAAFGSGMPPQLETQWNDAAAHAHAFRAAIVAFSAQRAKIDALVKTGASR